MLAYGTGENLQIFMIVTETALEIKFPEGERKQRRKGPSIYDDQVTGINCDHRREMIRQRLEFLAGIMGIKVLGDALMWPMSLTRGYSRRRHEPH